MADGHAASGDAAAGESIFKRCQSCHVVKNDAGDVLAGRAAKTGPNLYGIAGRTAGTIEDFKYSKSLQAANEAGIVFDEATFVAYVQAPTDYVKEATGTDSGRSKMANQRIKEDDLVNLYAYLVSLSE